MKCADTRLWIVLALIIGTVFGIGADGNQLADYSVSCNNARSMRTNSAEFCWMVSWVSATLYNRTNFNVYTTDAPITMIEQDLVAQAFATELVDMSSDRASKECKNAVRRFACVSVFPYCLKVGRSFSSSSYLPPCKMQCQHVNQACSTSLYAQVSDPVSIDCGAYKLDHNCLLNVPADRFLLSPQQVKCSAALVLVFIQVCCMSFLMRFAFFCVGSL